MLEAEFCEKTGVGRADARDFRLERLKEGLDWVNSAPGEVRLLESGLQALRAHFGVEAQKKEAGVLRAARKCHVRNRRILLCKTADGEMARCRVKDSSKFVPGQELPARHVQADLWEFVGPHPRKKGRLIQK